MDWIKLPLEPRHLGVPSGASKMISEPMVYLAWTKHLSCTGSSTVSKRTEMRFQMAHVTKEFHWVCRKHFLSLWYVWSKSCHLASRLALSPNRLNRAFTWASSPWSIIGWVQHDFLSLWHIWRKPCTYLAPTLKLSPNRPKRDSTWPKPSRIYIRCVQNNFWAYGMFGVKHAPILHQDLHYHQSDWIELPLSPAT
jgi:hypothetical protein